MLSSVSVCPSLSQNFRVKPKFATLHHLLEMYMKRIWRPDHWDKILEILNRQGPKVYTVYILALAKIGEKCHLVPVG